MKVYTYQTSGGKDLIYSYIDALPKAEKAEGHHIIELLEEEGLKAFSYLDTRQIRKKLWEIKFRDKNRIFYVVNKENGIYLVHACKKQKGKAEKFEVNKAERRAKKILDKE